MSPRVTCVSTANQQCCYTKRCVSIIQQCAHTDETVICHSNVIDYKSLTLIGIHTNVSGKPNDICKLQYCSFHTPQRPTTAKIVDVAHITRNTNVAYAYYKAIYTLQSKGATQQQYEEWILHVLNQPVINNSDMDHIFFVCFIHHHLMKHCSNASGDRTPKTNGI